MKISVKLTLLTFMLIAAIPLQSVGQRMDVSLKSGSPVRGEFKDTSIEKLTVGTVEISVDNIRNVILPDEPLEMKTARKRFEDSRFDDGLAELDKINEKISEKVIEQELDYMRVQGSAGSALNGGRVAAKEASRSAAEFVKKYPNSYRYFSVIESAGTLFAASGMNAEAIAEFKKLASSNLAEFKVRGNFNIGKVSLASGDAKTAATTLLEILNAEDNSESTQKIKVIADPLYAKALAFDGKVEEARKRVLDLIARESSENQELFAACYNVLGICDKASGDLKSAALNFLHTDLLFRGGDSHAEALYYLASEIWPKLEKADLALEARESLKRLYPGSFWYAKLNK
jgi:ATP/maltotriose-dependent transcriptional regulator MalT